MNRRFNCLLIAALFAGIVVQIDGQRNSIKEPIDREFLVGRAMAFALVGSNPCSFVVGDIIAATPSAWTQQRRQESGSLSVQFRHEPGSLTLQIREHFGLSPAKLEIPHRKPLGVEDRYEMRFGSSIVLDSPKPGQVLGLFACPRAFSYSTTDEKEIASIEKSVEHFLDYKKRPETILEVPRTLTNETDRIFATYLAMFVTRNGAITFPDYTLTVVSQLMENDRFLSSHKGKSLQDLGMSMVRSLANLIEVNAVFVAKPETKEDSLRRVIEVAGSQRPFTPFALRVIARIKADGSVDIDRYLDATTKAKLRRSYERFTSKELGTDDYAVLARMLAASP